MICVEGSWSTKNACKGKFAAHTAPANVHTEVGHSTRSWELQSEDNLYHTDPCLLHASWKLDFISC